MLNERQKEAVEHRDGPLLVVAGAGAGKTRVITERIAHLIKGGVSPEKILAITFTNKAAKEMRERIEKRLLEKDLRLPVSFAERPFISTFHSLGANILREHARVLGLSRFFKIADREDARAAARRALKSISLDGKTWEPGKIVSIISREKNLGNNPSSYQENARGSFQKVVGKVWEAYERELAGNGSLDFDDLLLKTKDLLAREEVRKTYNDAWRYVHVDEYQDTNQTQYEILKLLAPHQNICVVGDLDQSIYSWRGADVKNLLRFEKDFPGLKTILLEENYRSTGNILSAANSVIAKNTLRENKRLFTKNNPGEKIILRALWNEDEEARFVAEKSRELIEDGAGAESIAVLYRTNFQSRVLEEAFLNIGVPYQVLGTKFFERKEVKDLLAYLSASLSPQNSGDLARVLNTPKRGLGKVAIAKILSGEKSALPVGQKRAAEGVFLLLEKTANSLKKLGLSRTLSFVLKESGLEKQLKEEGAEGEERLQNIHELISLSKRYDALEGEEASLKLLEDAALSTKEEEGEEKRGGVKLMTAHAAKGLEFEHVFISGLEQGLFPHERVEEKQSAAEAKEEERRLFYVGLTRAKKRVYLSYASSRSIYGNRQINLPSEFLSDIDNSLVESEEAAEKTIYLE